MPRLPLFLLALLVVAACDSSSPEDALVGTWTLSGVRTDVQATSRTAQTIPDRSAAPTGAITVTGATRASLGRVANLFADPDGNLNLAVESTDPLSTTGYVQLVVSEFVSESQASLIDADAGLSYNAYFTPRRSLVARTGGRFTVAPVVMSNGNVTATASGILQYPEVALAPGTPTRVESYEESIDGTLQFVFAADGSFRATALAPDDDQSVTGTWEIVGGDEVRITARQAGQTETVTFRYSIEAGTLVLETRDLTESDCVDECVEFYEGHLFASRGSLSAINRLTTYRFSNRAQASARAVEAPARVRRPQPAPFPILGPLLPGR